MKRLLIALLAVLLAGAFPATQIAIAHTVSAQGPSDPDWWYQKGFDDAQAWTATNMNCSSPDTDACCAGWLQEKHRAYDNWQYYESIGDQRKAAYWHGYWEGLGYNCTAMY